MYVWHHGDVLVYEGEGRGLAKLLGSLLLNGYPIRPPLDRRTAIGPIY